VHLTETCEEDTPHVITDVQTTPAPRSDFDLLPTIQADLAAREVLPAEQLMDAGYVTAEHLVTRQRDRQVSVLGSVSLDSGWQAKVHQGFEMAAFGIDGEAHTATCPQGRHNTLWMPGHDRHQHAVINIRFARNDCQACPMRERCTHSPTEPRMLTVRPQEYHEAPKRHANGKQRRSLRKLMPPARASKARSLKAFVPVISVARDTSG
jgi:transposase